MVKGDDFEVSKEVYERAKANYVGGNLTNSYYMVDSDRKELFPETIRYGYGLYNCKVYEKNGKYMCSWWRGDSCD